jgi:mono/diheme cytochrome c family protein
MRRVQSSMLTLLVLAGLVPLMSALAAQQPGGSPEMKALKNPVASSAESVAAGQAAFQKYCRFCHGPDAKGNGPMAPKDTHPSDLTDAKWDRGSTDGEIFAVIRDGAAPKFEMKGFKGRMSETDMWNIVNYLRTLKAK